MNRSIHHLFLLVLIPMVFSCTEPGRTMKYSPEVEEKIRKVENNLSGWVKTQDERGWNLSERMDLYKVKGLCIAVIRDYRTEWVKGYGFADSSENRPVDEATLFQAASVSKCLNSLGILTLVRDDRLDLNEDINQYLSAWKFSYNRSLNYGPITTAALLSHTAGLNLDGFPGYRIGSPLPTLSQILNGKRPANTETLRAISDPGTKYKYSGGGILITQVILTDLTGRPYDEYMKENVLDPLGMTSSFFTQPPPLSVRNRLATGYMPGGNEIPGKYHIYPEQAAAGLWTNPADLAKYITDTQLSFRENKGKILSQELTKLRLTPVLENSAMGAFINRKGSSTWFSHSGGSAGFSCILAGSLDTGDGAVIMLNSDNGTIMQEILNSIATVYDWKDYYNPVRKEVIEIPVSALSKYTGFYEVGEGFVEVRLVKKQLYINVYGTGWKMFFTSGTDFFVFEERSELSFVINKDGVVTGIDKNGVFFRKIR